MSSTPPPDNDFAQASARIGLNVFVLMGARVLSLVLSLVQMGIIFRALDVAGRGQFGFSMQFASLFTILATLGIQRLLVRDIAREPGIAWRYVWAALVVVATLSTLIIGGLGVLSFGIEETPGERWAIVLAAVWVVGLWALQQPFDALLIARERMALVGLVQGVAAVLKLAAVFVLMRHAPTSATAHGAIALATLGGLALSVIMAVRVAGWERPRLRLGLALRQIRACYPFAVAMLMSQIYFRSDMSLLKFLSGDVAAGLYTPPQRVMEPLLMLAGLWGTAVFPALCRFSHAAPDDYRELKRISVRLVLVVSIPMAVGIVLVAGPVVDLLTGAAADARGSIPVLRVLALVTPFFYFNGVAQEFLYSAHRNWFVVSAFATGAVVSVAANLVAIPLWGALGAACVAVVTNGVVCAVLVYALRAELGGMHLPALIAKTLVACGVMAAVVWWFLVWSWVLAVAGGGVVYLLAQALLRTLNPTENHMLRGMAGAVAGAWRQG